MTRRQLFLVGLLLPGGLVLSPLIAGVWLVVERMRERNRVTTYKTEFGELKVVKGGKE